MLYANPLLIVSTSPCFTGGLERFVEKMTGQLHSHGHALHALFLKKSDEINRLSKHPSKNSPKNSPDYFPNNSPFVTVFDDALNREKDIQLEDFLQGLKKRGVEIALVNALEQERIAKKLSRFFKLFFFVHDHNYYCPRRHKGFSFLNYNCSLPYRPLVCTPCASLSRNRPSPAAKLLPVLKKSDGVLVFSNYMKNQLLQNGIPENLIQVIPPIVSPVFFESKHHSENFFLQKKNKNSHPVNIVFVGQLISGKGVDVLLKAIAELKKRSEKVWKKNDDFSFEIVGDSSRISHFESLAKKFNIAEKVFFRGETERPEIFMKRADFVVVPSRWQEPFGLVGVEAMALGKPVVAFDRGGISQWLKDGKTGILVKGISAKALADAMQRLIFDKELRLKMGKAASEYANKHYSPSVAMSKLEKILGNTNEKNTSCLNAI